MEDQKDDKKPPRPALTPEYLATDPYLDVADLYALDPHGAYSYSNMRRRMARGQFPQGIMTSPRKRVWRYSAFKKYLDEREREALAREEAAKSAAMLTA